MALTAADVALLNADKNLRKAYSVSTDLLKAQEAYIAALKAVARES